jgi:hypothetical protein
MSFLKKLGGLFSSSSGTGKGEYWLYARCAWCGEKLRTRVNLYNDLSINYGENDSQNYYVCRKVLVGDQHCFRRIEIKLTFNANRKLIDQEIIGGEFISAEEFEAD